MRAFKILSISLILATIAILASMDRYQEPSDIRVSFSTRSAKDVNYQIFYTDTEDGKFNEKQSVKKLVSAGINNVEIILPTENVFHFRLDFGVLPGTVYISDLKLNGHNTIKLLADKEDKYTFSSDIDEHQFMDGGELRIVSNHGDPFMIYKPKLNVTRGTSANWTKLLQIALGTFFITCILGLFLTRKKAEKSIQDTKPEIKSKK